MIKKGGHRISSGFKALALYLTDPCSNPYFAYDPAVPQGGRQEGRKAEGQEGRKREGREGSREGREEEREGGRKD